MACAGTLPDECSAAVRGASDDDDVVVPVSPMSCSPTAHIPAVAVTPNSWLPPFPYGLELASIVQLLPSQCSIKVLVPLWKSPTAP